MTKSIIDLSGLKFDFLQPLAVVGANKQKNTLWLCKCDCGKTKIVAANYLKRKDRIKSCGCNGRNKWDCIIGQRFGFWTVKEKLKQSGKRLYFICQCDCGTIKMQASFDLINKKTQSCGCAYRKKRIEEDGNICTRKSNIKNDHPLYRTWILMKNRCENPSDRKWHRYGGRGIKVCDRWQNFAFFVKDLYPKPPGTSLDRIDNNGNYGPSNCRWATARVQAQNTRRNVLIKNNDTVLCVSEWARKMKVSRQTILTWNKAGWGEIMPNPSD